MIRKKRDACTSCGKPLPEARIVVQVADAFAHEAPAGSFCGRVCFLNAVSGHRGVDTSRLIADCETVRGVE